MMSNSSGVSLPGLLRISCRHERLAEIVEHSRKACLATLLFIEPDLASERDHQRAHRHGVHVGVFVSRLETREAAERIGMPIDRLGDIVDERVAFAGVDRLAHARFAVQIAHGLRGAGAELGGVLNFGGERYALHLRTRRRRCRLR